MRLSSSHASRPTAPAILTLCLVSLASAVSDQRLAELETLNALGHQGLSCGDVADKLAEACDQPIGSNGRRGICLCATSNKPRMIFPLSDNTPDCDLFTMASRIAAQGETPLCTFDGIPNTHVVSVLYHSETTCWMVAPYCRAHLWAVVSLQNGDSRSRGGWARYPEGGNWRSGKKPETGDFCDEAF